MQGFRTNIKPETYPSSMDSKVFSISPSKTFLDVIKKLF
jgi:hypothetical protein